MAKMSGLSLSSRDKTLKPSGWGHNFHHTTPQRRVPCPLGDMLAPISADDIPPITPEAMASVQAAIELLANLVGDRDLGRFMGNAEDRLDTYREKARDILGVARSLTGILRVVESQVSDVPMAPVTPVPYDASAVDLPTRSSGQRVARSSTTQGADVPMVPATCCAALIEDDAASIPILSPVMVEKYLRRTGWHEPQARSATFATFNKALTWLDVPVWREHFAYPQRFRELLGKLSKIESRPVAKILCEIKNTWEEM